MENFRFLPLLCIVHSSASAKTFLLKCWRPFLLLSLILSKSILAIISSTCCMSLSTAGFHFYMAKWFAVNIWLMIMMMVMMMMVIDNDDVCWLMIDDWWLKINMMMVMMIMIMIVIMIMTMIMIMIMVTIMIMVMIMIMMRRIMMMIADWWL